MSAIGPGDYVECVDASPSQNLAEFGAPSGLQLGAIYRVCRLAPLCPTTGIVGLLLAGVKCSSYYGFRPERFRPIYSPKADLLTSLLTPVDGAKPRVTA